VVVVVVPIIPVVVLLFVLPADGLTDIFVELPVDWKIVHL